MSIVHELQKIARELRALPGEPQPIRLTIEQWERVQQEIGPSLRPLDPNAPKMTGQFLWGVPVKVYANREELERAFMLEQHEIKPFNMFRHDWHD